MIRISIFLFSVCFVLIGLQGCSLPVDLSPQQDTHFQLAIEPASTKPQAVVKFPTLSVREARGDSFVNSHRILFSDDPLKMGYYQFAHWVEPPPRQITTALIEQIEASGLVGVVSRQDGSTRSDFELSLEILEFFHDINKSPGSARVKIRFDLIDAKRRRILSRKIIEKSVPVERYNSRGAVVALSKASSEVLDDCISWLSSEQTSEPRIDWSDV